MSLSFDLNLAMVVSPTLALIFAYVVKRAKDAVINHMDENRDKAHELAEKRHKENVAAIAAVQETASLALEQAQQTNGKVAVHDKDITAIKTQNEMLMRLYLKGQPE